jgi:hypothetical protein
VSIPFAIVQAKPYTLLLRYSRSFQVATGVNALIEVGTEKELTEALTFHADAWASRLGVSRNMVYRLREWLGVKYPHGGARVKAKHVDIDPALLDCYLQAIGSGQSRTIVATIDKLPLTLVKGTNLVFESAIEEDVALWLIGVTVRDAATEIGVSQKVIVNLRKLLNITERQSEDISLIL